MSCVNVPYRWQTQAGGMQRGKEGITLNIRHRESIQAYFEKIRDDRKLDDDAFADHVRDFCKYLQESVEVIWYEVETDQTDRDGEEIFMSLNRGRIPLESSELIKTLLLVRASRAADGDRDGMGRNGEVAFRS